ncbi:hypothetical protein PoB_005047100 [Plakobranchus ocellatus]|uniref:Uncharacterized protein n=1 Tax=Plakobranchus ocellatus TaxID=259542 RepID=A0AAV4BKX6_9GAST|nr:hypothetical protein PoB_005047100 [Plakobranchus ocellatus]
MTSVKPAPLLRYPPGLPRRPLSQGPVPLNAGSESIVSPLPPSGLLSSSSSSSSLSSLTSVKLPSKKVARPTMTFPTAVSQTLQQKVQPQPQPTTQQTSTFERLVQTIQETFPNCTR